MIHKDLARVFLQNKFWGPVEWMTHYGVQFSTKQLFEMSCFPWDEDVLNSSCPFFPGRTIKETHFAFLGLETMDDKPLNIMTIFKLEAKNGSSLPVCLDYWTYNQPCLCVPCRTRWYLMPFEVPSLKNKAFDQQQAMLPPEYETANTVEEILKVLFCFKIRGELLHVNTWVRCQDEYLDSDSIFDRFLVGTSSSTGIRLDCQEDYLAREDIGIAVSRKFPKTHVIQK